MRMFSVSIRNQTNNANCKCHNRYNKYFFGIREKTYFEDNIITYLYIRIYMTYFWEILY